MQKKDSFQALGLSMDSLSAVQAKGFTQPSPIQEKVIPLLLAGNKNIIGQAQTGTGKTAAFGLPILEKIDPRAREVQALVLVPTRELAIQVAGELASLRGRKNARILPIYGGQSIQPQIRGLQQGVQIVVGTPGRVLDHLRQKTLRIHNLAYCILDEADEMLNMGFLEDVKKILSFTNTNKSTLMFSATMPQEILTVARKYMGDFELVQIGEATMTVPQTDQTFIPVRDTEKYLTLCQLIDHTPEFYGLVFCRTKHEARKLAKRLANQGYAADSLHGNLTQAQREKVMMRFRKSAVRILVATDVASRGIDVMNLSHVINYALPQDPESYVHRIGRTGRAGKAGKAVTFVGPNEDRKLRAIEKMIRIPIRKSSALPQAAPLQAVPVKKNRFMDWRRSRTQATARSR